MTESDPAYEITDAESAVLVRETQEARDLDAHLARALERAEPTGATSSAVYLRGLGRRPRLSSAGERQLILAAQDGDRQAREELVEAFLPLIAGVARAYRSSPSITRVELIQEGVVGLLRALERYDADLEVPFWGYASWWVRQALQQLVAELTRPLVLSDRTLRQLAQVKRARGIYVSEHGREPTGDELASRTGLSHAQLRDLLAADGIPQSLDEPVAGAEGEIGALGDLISDPRSEDAYQQLLDTSEVEQVHALLGGLNDRERSVLRARYGLDGPLRSLREIGEEHGLSAERVRQIEQRALGKLRAAAG